MQTSFLPIDLVPPSHDCAEISLFGPGVGECLVIHYGDGDWFIVDSCINRNTKLPIALDYLKALGVSSDQVKGILITHWHKDHTAGAATLVKEFSSAKIYISSALTSSNAVALCELYKKSEFNSIDQGVREFSEILKHLYSLGDKSKFSLVSSNHLFFDKPDRKSRLIALSPSNAAQAQAVAALAQIGPKAGGERLELVLPSTENLNAVALHFSFGGISALLGADLECRKNPDIGWEGILRQSIYQDLNLSRSDLFKVPHHGSVSAHNEGIWDLLLASKPISFTTPYSRSGLPRVEDIERIKSRSSVFGVTSYKKAKKLKRDKIVESAINAVAKSITPINHEIGHIQVRITDAVEVRACSNHVSF